eukprot:g3803.t1
MASPSPKRHCREALAERRLNGAGGAGDQVTSASSDATHARVASAAPATFAPSLVRAEFNDVCVRMAKIGREVNDLILRGCYLSQQTMMDAESNQRSAFRIAAEPLIEDAAATEGTVDAEEPEEPSTSAPVSPIYRLSGDSDSRPKLFDPENTLGLIAQGFSLSRLSEERLNGGAAAAAPPAPRRDGASGHSRNFLEHASRRGLETVRRIFMAWRRRTWVRICITQRLKGTRALKGSAKGAHSRLGTKRPFDPAAVFARDGKHRMAREWRENRMKRVCIAKLMINLIRDDAQEQCHPSGVEMCAGTRIR